MVTVPGDAPAWAHRFAADLTRELTRRTGFPAALASYSVADLPDPVRWAGTWIYVRDASGGAIPAYSNGATWRRPDNTLIS